MTSTSESSHRPVLVAGMTLVLSVLEAGVISRAWASCDVGVNASANNLTLSLFGIPVLWGVHLLAAAAVAGAANRILNLTQTRSGVRSGVHVAASALAAAGVAALVFVYVATPADYPAPLCPSNVPPWWPVWLPA